MHFYFAVTDRYPFRGDLPLVLRRFIGMTIYICFAKAFAGIAVQFNMQNGTTIDLDVRMLINEIMWLVIYVGDKMSGNILNHCPCEGMLGPDE